MESVVRIRRSFHADSDPGSQKCLYGSGSKEVPVNPKEINYTNKFSTESFKMTLNTGNQFLKNNKI